MNFKFHRQPARIKQILCVTIPRCYLLARKGSQISVEYFLLSAKYSQQSLPRFNGQYFTCFTPDIKYEKYVLNQICLSFISTKNFASSKYNIQYDNILVFQNCFLEYSLFKPDSKTNERTRR